MTFDGFITALLREKAASNQVDEESVRNALLRRDRYGAHYTLADLKKAYEAGAAS